MSYHSLASQADIGLDEMCRDVMAVVHDARGLLQIAWVASDVIGTEDQAEVPVEGREEYAGRRGIAILVSLLEHQDDVAHGAAGEALQVLEYML